MTEITLTLVVDCLRDQSDALRALPVIDEDTALFGERGLLDSIGLVNLIADLEERLERDYQRAIVLADERAMSRFHSPFRRVGTLAAFIAQKLAEPA